MRKSTAVILAVVGILLLAACGGMLIKGDRNDGSWSARWFQRITTSDRQAQPGETRTEFSIDEDGEYHFALSWLPEGTETKDLDKISSADVGFITALTLLNAQGEEIYATSAAAITIETDLEMEKGNYAMVFHYITNRDDYVEFAKVYLCGAAMAEQWADGIDFDALQKDGDWTMKYVLKVSPAEGWTVRAVWLFMGILVGICLVFMLVAAFTKGAQIESPKYDERQKLEQGRAYGRAFFTMLIYDGVLLCFNLGGLIPPADACFLYACGLFLGINVYCVYSIWHECYFALNQKTATVLICFAGISLINLVFGLSNLLNGTLLENGRITFRVLNLLCAALFLSIGLTVLARKIYLSRTASTETEEDEGMDP